MGHARLSASNTKTWATCAGQVPILEERGGERDEGNFFANLGTCAHAVVERCLREGSEPSKYLGRYVQIILDSENNVTGVSILKEGAQPKGDLKDVGLIHMCDQEMVEATTKMTDYVRMRCLELGLLNGILGKMSGEGKIAQGVAELVKRGVVRLEVHVVPLPDRDDTGGTGDVVIDAWPELIEVVDYKNGSGVFVPVKENMQLRSYGLGTLNEFGFDDYERVRYTICQPRHIESPPSGIMWEEMSVKEIKSWGNWLHGRAEEVDVARAMVAAGAGMQELFDAGLLSVGEDGSHCHWCNLQDECPAKRAKVQELVEVDFDDDPFDLEAPSQQSTNHLGVLIPWVPFIESWTASIMKNAELALLSGTPVPGRKLVHGSSTRKRNTAVTDDEIVEYLGKEGVDDKDKMFNPPAPATLRTGPQLEKLLPAKKRSAFSEFAMIKPPGKLTMVPEDDDRPAVLVNAGDDFDDEPEIPE